MTGPGNTAVGKAACFALCDVYDALTSERPYKVAWTRAAALAEIEAQAGQHFDPVLTWVFVDLFGQGEHEGGWTAQAP